MKPSPYAFTWSRAGRQSRAMDAAIAARRTPVTRDVNLTVRLQDGRMVSVWLTPAAWLALQDEAR